MGLPRISLAGSLSGVAVAAPLGLAVVHEDLTSMPFHRHGHSLVVGALPMACVLTWGLLVGAGGLYRRGECRSVLVGFEVLGWAAPFLFVCYVAATYRSGEKPIDLLDPCSAVPSDRTVSSTPTRRSCSRTWPCSACRR